MVEENEEALRNSRDVAREEGRSRQTGLGWTMGHWGGGSAAEGGPHATSRGRSNWGQIPPHTKRGRLDGTPVPPQQEKEVFGAELYTLCRALQSFGSREERDRSYTISSDSAASGSIGPGQRLAATAIEA